MTHDKSALLGLLESLCSADEGVRMRQVLAAGLQMLIDAEADAQIGAGRHERTATRTTQRNGTRDRLVATTAGDVTVAIPKTRTGSFFPSLLQPRRRVDRALHAVVCEAYVHGVSTRKVDDLVAALGVESGLSKSEVSRVCAQLDEEVTAWRDRPLDHTWFPYLFLDATYVKVRLHGRVTSQAVVVATGVSIDGRREILGHAVGDAETEPFWADFLRGLRDRGLAVGGDGNLGVQLVISDAHRGLTNAIGQILGGAAWQRCRVHFMRNLLAKVPRGQTGMVAAMVRTIFASPTPGQIRDQVDVVAAQLSGKFSAAAELLLDAKADITAFADFPQAHWLKVWSNNPIERLNREIKRRTDVVGIFPNPAAIDRLVGAILIEAHDEWQAADRRYLSEASMAPLLTPSTVQHAELPPDRPALGPA
jgi:putative transposase